jgi:hypothetical protein
VLVDPVEVLEIPLNYYLVVDVLHYTQVFDAVEVTEIPLNYSLGFLVVRCWPRI